MSTTINSTIIVPQTTRRGRVGRTAVKDGLTPNERLCKAALAGDIDGMRAAVADGAEPRFAMIQIKYTWEIKKKVHLQDVTCCALYGSGRGCLGRESDLRTLATLLELDPAFCSVSGRSPCSYRMEHTLDQLASQNRMDAVLLLLRGGQTIPTVRKSITHTSSTPWPTNIAQNGGFLHEGLYYWWEWQAQYKHIFRGSRYRDHWSLTHEFLDRVCLAGGFKAYVESQHRKITAVHLLARQNRVPLELQQRIVKEYLDWRPVMDFVRRERA